MNEAYAAGLLFWAAFWAVIWATVTWLVAEGKGRCGLPWGVLAIVFGPLALVIVALMPRGLSSGKFVRCRFCQEFIAANALRCPKCASQLTEMGYANPGQQQVIR